jgi:hypothetical protein
MTKQNGDTELNHFIPTNWYTSSTTREVLHPTLYRQLQTIVATCHLRYLKMAEGARKFPMYIMCNKQEVSPENILIYSGYAKPSLIVNNVSGC